MKIEIINRLDQLRKEMNNNHIDAYYLHACDYHLSEYFGDFFKSIEYLSSFTGESAQMVVLKDAAYLWSDGRYFIQGVEQLEGTTIEFMKSGLDGVPAPFKLLADHLDTIKTIGFDGKCVSCNEIEMLKNNESFKNIKLVYDLDLVNNIWYNRPEISKKAMYELDIKYAGKTRSEKIQDVRLKMEKDKANVHIISSLDDIAWLLNVRGNDVHCNPVVMAYCLITKDIFNLYVFKDVLNDDIVKSLNNDGITIKDYYEIYDDAKKINENDVVVLNKGKMNYCLYANIPAKKIINQRDYSTIFKAVKNEVEQKNAYLCHERDGVAVIKTIYWLKQNINKRDIYELDVCDKLVEERSKQINFKDISFDSIVGYGPHGAIIHYGPTKETNIKIDQKSFVLIDSGAQYLEGTTDITRTVAVGPLTEEEKYHYTLVLKSHLDLGDAVFKKGTSGQVLDIIARSPLWNAGLDYRHGTGHGVGSFLNVHEGPQSISGHPSCTYPFEVGMTTSNEPGLYFEGKYGIRIENMIICEEKLTNEWGTFLHFNNLTLVPYEIDAIKVDMLTDREKELIHNYHERILNTIGGKLSKDERSWLESICKAI